MKKNEELVLEYLMEMFPNWHLCKRLPGWIKKEFWRPTFLLKVGKGEEIAAVDVLLSGEIPKYQYLRVVGRLLKEHPELRGAVVTLEESYEDNPEIEEFCRKHCLGLKIMIPGVGLETIVRSDLDPDVSEANLVREDGWFPAAILRAASGLKRLCFSDVIDKFIGQVGYLGNDMDETREVVFATIEQLVRKHSTFSQNLQQFMQLARFEEMLRSFLANESEHVIHSFRVFLAGCPVIDKFYDEFRVAHRRFSIDDPKNISVEYAWLLTAVFHDIGRRKEGTAQAVRMLGDSLEDEDVEVSVEGKESRWSRTPYIEARKVLGSLGAFVRGDGSGSWDGGVIEDEDGALLSVGWIHIYDEMRSHGIISAFDFLAKLFEKASAASERIYRPFVITHGAPAGLAILLHDWKIWKPEALSWGLYPINASVLPLAALLIYVDTWDDYKRKDGDPCIYVRDYTVDGRGARVRIEWGDSEQLEKEKIKYNEFRLALKRRPFSLKIEADMADKV